MRKLLMLAVMALAALAVSAPSAFAVNPDFPYDDYDAENWRAVTVYDEGGVECDSLAGPYPGCPLEAGSFSQPWKNPSNFAVQQTTCEYDGLSGEVGPDGSVEINEIDEPISWDAYHFCGYLNVEDEPWTGLICAHVPSGEIWTRQEVAYDHVTQYVTREIRGETFGELSGYEWNGALIASGIEFGDAGWVRLGTDQYGSVYQHRLDLPLSTTSIVYATGAEAEPMGAPAAPCGWEELEA